MSIRRILVALDASRHSLAALEAAVEMAAELNAEVLGVFVEDINLLRLADFPFAREMGHQTARSRELDIGAMRRTLKRLATLAERALATAAGRRQVAYSFRVVRGPVVSELIAAAREVDLVTIGRSSQVAGRSRLGSTAIAMLTSASSAVLLLEQQVCFGAPVLALYDGSESSRLGLSAAANLASVRQDQLIVLILARSALDAQRFEQQAVSELKSEELRVQFHSLLRADITTVAQTVRSVRPSVVVVDGSSEYFGQGGFQRIIEAIGCPVYVVK